MKPPTADLRQMMSRLSVLRLTRLGVIVLAVVTALIAIAVVMLIMRLQSDDDQAAAPQAVVVEKTAERVFTTGDAIDFVQLTFAGYLAAVVAESPGAASAAPPYDSAVMIKRLQAVKTQFSPNLYKTIEASYRQTASVTTIIRDEVLCGRPDVTNITSKLQLNGRESAVIRLELQRPGGVGLMEVTVDLIGRQLSEIRCLQ